MSVSSMSKLQSQLEMVKLDQNNVNAEFLRLSQSTQKRLAYFQNFVNELEARVDQIAPATTDRRKTPVTGSLPHILKMQESQADEIHALTETANKFDRARKAMEKQMDSTMEQVETLRHKVDSLTSSHRYSDDNSDEEKDGSDQNIEFSHRHHHSDSHDELEEYGTDFFGHEDQDA